jgi:hypothetical protein
MLALGASSGGDAEGLGRFMRQRLTDRSPSVVVFSIDHLPAGVTETLVLDDNGLASSWVKRYGGQPGTGFVRVYGGSWSAGGPTANLAAVQAVAEYMPR